MPRPERQCTFTYRDLAELCGMTPNGIAQHISRGKLDPDNLRSVALFLARYAAHDLRLEMLDAATRRDVPADPGGWNRKREQANSPS